MSGPSRNGGSALPPGGTPGQHLVRGSDGRAVWADVTLPPVTAADLDPTLSAEISSRIGTSRRADFGNLGTAQTLTVAQTDDQGWIFAYATLNADGVLTIDGYQAVTRTMIAIVVKQDATGNHTFAVKDNLSGTIWQIDVDPAPNDGTDPMLGTFVLAWTDDGTTLNVVGPGVSDGGGGGGTTGSGIPKATISGTPGIGNVLTATPPAILKPDTVQYQWQRSPDGSVWTDIAGATTNQYTPVSPDDAGQHIDCAVWGQPLATSDAVLIPSTDPDYVATAAQGTATSANQKLWLPAGVAVGDLVYGCITVPGDSTIDHNSVPSPWLPVASDPVANPHGRYVNTVGTVCTQFYYYMRVTQAILDAGTTSWSFPATASKSYRSRSIALRNCLATDPPHELVTHDTASPNSTFNSSLTAHSLTASEAKEMFLAVASFPQSTLLTWTGGVLTNPSGSDYQQFGYKLLSASGASGDFAGTLSQNSGKSVVGLLVKPAGG